MQNGLTTTTGRVTKRKKKKSKTFLSQLQKSNVTQILKTPAEWLSIAERFSEDLERDERFVESKLKREYMRQIVDQILCDLKREKRSRLPLESVQCLVQAAVKNHLPSLIYVLKGASIVADAMSHLRQLC